MFAVILLGVATVGSAWCGYQATRWNGEQDKLVRESTDARVEASRLFSLATQIVAYDTNVVGQFAQAAAAKNQQLMDFYRRSLVRPAFVPILDRWLAEVKAGQSPQNLLDDKDYLDTQFGPYRKAQAQAEEYTRLGEEASNNSDAFVLTTLLLAVGLFFAGVTSSFRFPPARFVLLVGAALAIALAAARLVDLPIL